MLRCALRGHPFLAVKSWLDLGRPGSFGSSGHGGVLAGMTYWLARQEFRDSLRR